MKFKIKKHKAKLIFVGAIIALLALIYVSYGYFSSTTTNSVSTADGSWSQVNWVSANITAVTNATNLTNASIYGTFGGAWAKNASNTSVIGNNTAFILNATTLGENTTGYIWNVEVCDAEGCTWVFATNKTLKVDTINPTFATYVNYNYTSGNNLILQENVTVTETNKDICRAEVYQGTSTTQVYGSYVSNVCVVTVNPSSVPSEGMFTIGWYANDSSGRSARGTNQTNFTKTTLYSGWNLIHMDRNITLGNISFLANTITSVSAWSNTNHNYTTWVYGASANSATAVVDGDAVYVNVNATTSLLRFWQTDVGSRNITLTNGWNQISFFNTTSEVLGDVCTKTLDNSSSYMSYATFVDMSQSAGSRYITKPCSLTLSASQAVPKGQGVWVNVNATTTFGISRN